MSDSLFSSLVHFKNTRGLESLSSVISFFEHINLLVQSVFEPCLVCLSICLQVSAWLSLDGFSWNLISDKMYGTMHENRSVFYYYIIFLAKQQY